MKRLTTAIIGLCAGLVVAGGCKKNNDNPVRSNLIGSWKAVNNAKDKNGNGTMDAAETTPDSIYTGFVLAFAANGTLTYTQYGSFNGLVNWQLTEGNTILEIADTTGHPTTKYYHIDNITAAVLTLKDTPHGSTTWTVFAKQ